jgi:predicted small metal-binding protein
MAKELRCRDLGIECNQVIRARTQEELIERVAEHVLAVHGFDPVDAFFNDTATTEIYTIETS